MERSDYVIVAGTRGAPSASANVFTIFIFLQHYRKAHPNFRGNTVMFIPITAVLPLRLSHYRGITVTFVPITVTTAVKWFGLSHYRGITADYRGITADYRGITAVPITAQLST